MILWLLVIILAYFFFSLSSLGDKLILSGPPKPRTYTFYIGIFGLSVFLFLPFMDFSLPKSQSVLWIVSEAIIYILGVYATASAIKKFEVSKVATTMGALMPIFVLVMTWLVWGGQIISKTNLLAFMLLLAGGIIISIEKKIKPANGYFTIILLASFLFSLDYILTKIIFLTEPFLLGLFWMRLIASLLVLFLLLSRKARREIIDFLNPVRNGVSNGVNKKAASLLILTQTAGGTANILQAFAISLAPVAMLPILNSLRGVQYVFLFLITLFFSLFLPKILKEKISKKIILQKTFSIILIASGLTLLVL